MNEKKSYVLNGADRFQLFFDSVAKQNTGTGNIILAAVIVDGMIREQDFRNAIASNQTFQQIRNTRIKKKIFLPFFRFVTVLPAPGDGSSIIFHDGESPEVVTHRALLRDFKLATASPIHLDVIAGKTQTTILFSISHAVMDHAGMENLLSAFTGETSAASLHEVEVPVKSFIRKFLDAIQVSFFMASISGWNMRRLKGKSGMGKPAVKKLELSEEESEKARDHAANEIQTNSLSFFLGCSLFSMSRHEKLLMDTKGNFLVAVPVDRRSGKLKNTVRSNFISFLFFHAKAAELKSVKETASSISNQMIAQARKNLPEKFSSLLDLFRYIPAPVYKAFINLPSNGHSGTFAFSLLSGSGLENKSFMGLPVVDVTHYAPVISPPGLNIVFAEFNRRLKIILSFDENRISRNDAQELLNTIRKSLLNE